MKSTPPSPVSSPSSSLEASLSEVRESPFGSGALERIISVISRYPSLMVTVSGGLDSMTLFAVAVGVLGRKAVGFFAATETLSSRDREEMERAFKLVDAGTASPGDSFLKEKGKPESGKIITVESVKKNIFNSLRNSLVIKVEYSETSNVLFRANPPDRCYHCKRMLFSHAKKIAESLGIEHITDGSTLDDEKDYRPGLEAGKEMGILHLWQKARCGKEDVRTVAREIGLRWAERTASPCLASRIPYGCEVTRERLEGVRILEDFLFAKGFDPVRVRWHGTLAKIEVEPERIPRILANGMKEEIVKKAREAGFHFVCVDIEGFHSGALNRELQKGP